MIIVISGDPRSGKSTFGQWIAKQLNYTYFYTGGLIEEAASFLGIPKELYYELLDKEPNKEREIDHKQAQIIHHSNNIVVEGRIAPFIHTHNKRFIKINMLFTVHTREAARRLQKKRGYEEKNIDELVAHLLKRREEEHKHYWHLYHIKNHLDSKHFHIHIDTTNMTISEMQHEGLKKLQEFQKNKIPFN